MNGWNRINRHLTVTYRSLEERDKRVNDLLARGYTVVKDVKEVDTTDRERSFKIDTPYKSKRPMPRIGTEIRHYVVMRLPDELYERLLEKEGS